MKDTLCEASFTPRRSGYETIGTELLSPRVCSLAWLNQFEEANIRTRTDAWSYPDAWSSPGPWSTGQIRSKILKQASSTSTGPIVTEKNRQHVAAEDMNVHAARCLSFRCRLLSAERGTRTRLSSRGSVFTSRRTVRHAPPGKATKFPHLRCEKKVLGGDVGNQENCAGRSDVVLMWIRILSLPTSGPEPVGRSRVSQNEVEVHLQAKVGGRSVG